MPFLLPFLPSLSEGEDGISNGFGHFVGHFLSELGAEGGTGDGEEELTIIEDGGVLHLWKEGREGKREGGREGEGCGSTELGAEGGTGDGQAKLTIVEDAREEGIERESAGQEKSEGGTHPTMSHIRHETTYLERL